MTLFFVAAAIIFPFLSALAVCMVVFSHSYGTIFRLVEKKKLDAAINEVNSISALRESDFSIVLFLAKALSDAGRHGDALNVLQKIPQDKEFSDKDFEIDFRATLADEFLFFEHIDEADGQYEILAKIAGDDTDILFKAGEIKAKKKEYDKAAFFYKRATEADSGNYLAHKTLGILNMRARNFADACKNFESAMSANPQDNTLYYYLGRALRESKNYKNALAALSRCSHERAIKFKAAIEEGLCYFAMQNMDKAIAVFSFILKYHEELQEVEILHVRYYLASCYEFLGRIPDAVVQWKIIFSANQRFKDVRSRLEQYNNLPRVMDIKTKSAVPADKIENRSRFDDIECIDLSGSSPKVVESFKPAEAFNSANEKSESPVTGDEKPQVEQGASSRVFQIFCESPSGVFCDICICIVRDLFKLHTSKVEVLQDGCKILAVDDAGKKKAFFFLRGTSQVGEERIKPALAEKSRSQIDELVFLSSSGFKQECRKYENSDVKFVLPKKIIELVKRIYGAAG